VKLLRPTHPTVPILAKGKTVTGHIWTYVRDDCYRLRESVESWRRAGLLGLTKGMDAIPCCATSLATLGERATAAPRGRLLRSSSSASKGWRVSRFRFRMIL
jgi:hypothetical protein